MYLIAICLHDIYHSENFIIKEDLPRFINKIKNIYKASYFLLQILQLTCIILSKIRWLCWSLLKIISKHFNVNSKCKEIYVKKRQDFEISQKVHFDNCFRKGPYDRISRREFGGSRARPLSSAATGGLSEHRRLPRPATDCRADLQWAVRMRRATNLFGGISQPHLALVKRANLTFITPQ
jgi:hypothetical protein